jgi:hypothetical protein
MRSNFFIKNEFLKTILENKNDIFHFPRLLLFLCKFVRKNKKSTALDSKNLIIKLFPSQIILLSLCTSLLYSTTYAQENYLLNGKIATTPFLDTIPFEFKKNKIIIPIFLNGKQRRFILDTGAPVLISKELQQECQFKTIKKELISDINGRLDSTYYLQVPQIQIGKVSFEGITGGLADLNAGLLACFQIEGIIGSNLLKNSILHIDYVQKKIILTDQIQKLNLSRQNANRLLLEENQATPIIDIKPFPQAKEQVLIDTGDDGFYSMGLRSFQFFMGNTNLKEYVISQAKGADTYGLHGLEQDTTKHILHFDSLKIGSNYFSQVRITTYPNPNSRLGVELLKYGTVTIDYLNRQFYFVPFSKSQPIVLQSSRDTKLGFSLKGENNVLKIGAVWEGSQAWQMGMKPNETIEKINDYDLLGKNICELFFLLEQIFEKDASYIFTLSDEQGNKRTVTLQI